MPYALEEGRWRASGMTGAEALDRYIGGIAARLKLAREGRGLTRAEAAEAVEGVGVSMATVKNYENPRGHSQMRLSIVYALATAYRVDVRAVLGVEPYGTGDDAADLARGELVPTCSGRCTLVESDEGAPRWEIYEQSGGLSLAVVGTADGGERGIVMAGNARHAYEALCDMLRLDAATDMGIDVHEDGGILDLGGAELVVDRWEDAAQPAPAVGGSLVLNRRRRAREGDALASLGAGWGYVLSDGERRPLLRADGRHDAELVGYRPTEGGSCSLCWWLVPDRADPDDAREVGVVTGVPCDPLAVGRAVEHMRGACGDVGRYEVAYADIPRR